MDALGLAKLDHRVIVQRVWPDERQRLSGVTSIVSSLAKLAA